MNSRQAFVLYAGVALETLTLLFPPIETSLMPFPSRLIGFLPIMGQKRMSFCLRRRVSQ